MAEVIEQAEKKRPCYNKKGRPVLREGDKDELAAMRWVMGYKAGSDETILQRQMRKAFDRDTPRFMRDLRRLEAEEAKLGLVQESRTGCLPVGGGSSPPLAVGNPVGEIPNCPDGGTERALGLLRRCLGVGDDEESERKRNEQGTDGGVAGGHEA